MRAGFVAPATSRDHDYYFFHFGGRKTAMRVKISHGASELKPHEIRTDARTCRMTGNDMREVLACTHDKEWMEAHDRASQRVP